MYDMEILAPAGNLETLKSAIANGADAVYIGGKSFSARKNAVNFTNEELEEAVKFAHLYNAKVYVTFNTLIHDAEMKEAFDFAKFLYTAGVDALIVQDLGLIYMLKKYFPDFEIHASTQMTLHNMDGVKAAEKLGFSRVVLSRELSFEEIKSIKENTNAELEIFVHGALCMSYSGQCLMSSFLGCRSGNRGACAQPCRLPYSVYDENGKMICKAKYPLSLKDLCLVDELENLKNAGASSLKIEGRMKSPEYVSHVTTIYNKDHSGEKVSNEDMYRFTKGYLYQKYGRDMLNFDKNNDDVYSSIDKNVLAYAEELKNKKPQKIKSNVFVEIKHGNPVKATFSAKGKSVFVEGTVLTENAINTPLTKERISQQMFKTGNTPFEIDVLDIICDDGISLPVKEINNIRREGFEILENEISNSKRYTNAVYDAEKTIVSNSEELSYIAEVLNLNQAKAAHNLGFDKVLVPYSLYAENKCYFDKNKDKFCVVLPSVDRDIKRIDVNVNTDEIYVSSISQFEKYKNKTLKANYTLNAFNSLSLRTLSSLGATSVCLSPELNVNQLKEIDDFMKKEIIVYGRIPLMTLQNCVVKSSNNKCVCSHEPYMLKDRKGAMFPLIADKTRCINTIYNCKPIYMADKLSEIPLQGVDALRFVFTIENEEEIKEIYKNYKNNEKTSLDFTRGHFFRGV